MSAAKKALVGLRAITLVAALAVVGLSIWSKFIIHDVEIRGAIVLRNTQLESRDRERDWEIFFTAVVNGSLRIWISIAACSFAFLTSLLVVLSTTLRRLDMPGSVRVPLELLSMCAITTAFGCALSYALSLSTFTNTLLEASESTDLTMFAMIIPLSIGLAGTAGTGCILVFFTTITAMVQACLRARAKESCSFEPTASALGMGHDYQAIVPPVPRSRPPTMYDPRKPLPRELEKMPETDEEKVLVEDSFWLGRVDSGLSEATKDSADIEKEIAWPLSQEKSHVLQIRPSRPWSELPQQKPSSGTHAF